jgi:CRISPR-associated protein Cas1
MSRGALNVLELWPTVGYLHEFIGCQTKQSLVYDLQEPFRWIADMVVMQAFESEVLDLPDFYFTGDDYRYRFAPEAKERFLDLLRERFNSGVKYKGRALRWDTVIERKTLELGLYLLGRFEKIDLTEPRPILDRIDNFALRQRILNLSQMEAREIGIARSTLHYLRQRARNERPFKIRQAVALRIRRKLPSLAE